MGFQLRDHVDKSSIPSLLPELVYMRPQVIARNLGESYLWLAGNEGWEKKMETTIMGDIVLQRSNPIFHS